MAIHTDDILFQLLQYHNRREGAIAVPDASIMLSQPPSPRFIAEMDELLVSRVATRIGFLRRRYVAEPVGPDILAFKKGCLDHINLTTSTVYFRHRSEWFRKILSDLIYAESLMGGADAYPILIKIPFLWIRENELPTMALYFKRHKALMHPVLVKKAEQLASMPFSQMLAIKHDISRRYLIRYLVVTGMMNEQAFQWHRRNTLLPNEISPFYNPETGRFDLEYKRRVPDIATIRYNQQPTSVD